MAEYRAYIVGSNGHFTGPYSFFAPTDEAAKEYARQFVDRHDMELWQGDRKISEFKPTQVID